MCLPVSGSMYSLDKPKSVVAKTSRVKESSGQVLLLPPVPCLLLFSLFFQWPPPSALTNNVDRAVAVERRAPNEKILRLYIAVYNVLAVHIFQPGDELDCAHADRLQGEAAAAHVEKILEAWSEKLEHKPVVFSTRSKVVALWDSNCAARGERSGG